MFQAHSHIANYTFFCCAVATLRLVDERMQPVNDLYSVENEARVRLECSGTGILQWTSSTGLEIPPDRSGDIYQSYDHIRDALALVIQNFTSVTIATYTCMIDLTDAHNMSISISVLITNCKWRERERERERERRREREYAARIITCSSTANPAVIILSPVQYVLPSSSTALEARVFASPLSLAVVQWYHQGRLIDDTTEASYATNSSGDIYTLRVNGVSANEVGEYSIVVTLNGLNVTDRITLLFPGSNCRL